MPIQAFSPSYPVFTNSYKEISQISKKAFALIQESFSSPKSYFSWCVIASGIIVIAIVISQVIIRWIRNIKSQTQQHKYREPGLIRNLSFTDMKLTPCSSPVDLRSISPSVSIPKGIANSSNNSSFISSMQLIVQNEEIIEKIIDQLELVANDPSFERNPFMNFIAPRSHAEKQLSALKNKIVISEKEIAPLFEKEVSVWSDEKKVNLKSLYFHISLKNSAKLALYILKLWTKDFDNPIEFLSTKHAQLLRLSLVKIIYHAERSQIVHANCQDTLKVPGLNFGFHPLSQESLDPFEFIKKLHVELQNLSQLCRVDSHMIQKMTSFTTHQAKGLALGKITKSRTKLEENFALDVKITDDLNLSEYLSSLSLIKDSRGIVDDRTGKVTPLKMSYFISEGDLLPTHAKSLHHERIVSGYRFNKIFFVYLNIFQPQGNKIEEIKSRKIIFTEKNDFQFEFKSSIQKGAQNFQLKSFIAHLGPSKVAGHYINYTRKQSRHHQNVFFKCDDQTVTLANREEIQKIFDGTYEDPIWGSVTPYLLELERI